MVTCGREKITGNSKVFIYPYATMSKATKQYDRLWWCSKSLYRSSDGMRCARDMLANFWWTTSDVDDVSRWDDIRKERLLDLISYTWLQKVLRRELDETRARNGLIIPKGEDPGPLAGEWAPPQQGTEDVELTSFLGGRQRKIDSKF